MNEQQRKAIIEMHTMRVRRMRHYLASLFIRIDRLGYSVYSQQPDGSLVEVQLFFETIEKAESYMNKERRQIMTKIENAQNVIKKLRAYEARNQNSNNRVLSQ